MQQEALRTEFEVGEEPIALRIASKLRAIVDFVGRRASWLIVPLVIITCIDVIARKAIWRAADGSVQGLQIWLVKYVSRYFDSALMQELEWHFHTALFALVLGFGTIYNTHVRVDLIRDNLKFPQKVKLEFVGLTFFMIPFLVLTIYFAISYTLGSYYVGEVSPSAVGLSHRWIIKTVLVIGLILALVAGIAVWLQVAYLMWGDRTKRFKLMTLDWPEEEGSRIEGKERVRLENASDLDVLSPVGTTKPPDAADASDTSRAS